MKAARGKTIYNRKFRVNIGKSLYSELELNSSFITKIQRQSFYMKIIFTHFLFVIFAFSIFAQKPGEVLATANGQTFTVKNLSPETQKIYADLPAVDRRSSQGIVVGNDCRSDI
jgi:hypothetical protein